MKAGETAPSVLECEELSGTIIKASTEIQQKLSQGVEVGLHSLDLMVEEPIAWNSKS